MALFSSTTDITHGIQLAVAPVFLLTAVAGMISAAAGRLARIIDRGRVVEEKIDRNEEPALHRRWELELERLRRRGRLANATIGLFTLCAFTIGLTIVLLFLGETTDFKTEHYAIYAFLAGILFFMIAVGAFFAETWLATHTLRFGQRDEE